MRPQDLLLSQYEAIRNLPLCKFVIAKIENANAQFYIGTVIELEQYILKNPLPMSEVYALVRYLKHLGYTATYNYDSYQLEVEWNYFV